MPPAGDNGRCSPGGSAALWMNAAVSHKTEKTSVKGGGEKELFLGFEELGLAMQGPEMERPVSRDSSDSLRTRVWGLGTEVP